MRLRILPLIAAVMLLASAPEARATCSSPTDVESTLLYNQDNHVLQYCDGTNWIPMGRPNTLSGIIAWWKFDESSGTEASDYTGDYTGNGHKAVLYNGPTWQSAGGQIGGALAFDGTDDYANAGVLTDLSGLNKATLSAWMYRASTSDTAGFGESGVSAGGNYRFDVIWENDSTVYIEVDNNSTSYPNILKSETGWHHIAVVYDGTQSGLSRLTVYWDNVVQTLTPGQGAGGGWPAASLPSGIKQPAFYFGRDVGTGGLRYWGGRLDDVRVYNRALSAAEISDLYTNGNSEACSSSCSCANPTGAAGTILYNAAWRTPQYCDGTGWQRFGGIYAVWGMTFDGTNDYLTRGADLSGAATSTMVTGSFWFRRNGGNGTQQVLWCTIDTAGSCRFQIDLNTGNQIHLLGKGTGGGSTILDMRGGTAITDTNWHKVIFSFDLANTAKRYIYLDGAAETLTVTTYTNAVIALSRSEHSIGAFTDGAGKYNGDLADFWLNEGAYLDISVANNRELFRDAGGNAVNLGSDGSTPTGTVPIVFLSDSTSSTWPTNKGTGGGFTVTGGGGAPDPPPPRLACSSRAFPLKGSYNTPGTANTVWSDGAYIYVADGASGIEAFTFDGASFTLKGSYDTSGTAVAVWGDGTYIYVADSSGIAAFTFNGTTFTLAGSWYLGSVGGVWGSGGYIYVGGSHQFRVFTFNGSTFTQVGIRDDGAAGAYGAVWGNGTYAYVTDFQSVSAFSFNGSTLTLNGNYAATGYRAEGVWADGNYVYLADGESGILAFTFNGTTFTQVGSYVTTYAQGVWGDGTYIYVADGTEGLKVFTFDGTTFTPVGSAATAAAANDGVGSDSNYIYIAEGTTGIEAFSKTPTSCSCASPTATEGTILYNGDYHVLQYCDGVTWRGIGK